MTKITDIITDIKESEMDENILDKTKMTKEEKERTANMALNKIRAEQNSNNQTSGADRVVVAPSRRSRKFVAVAAAMVMMLAFGAVAYATDFLQFGKVGSGETSYTADAIEDSKQHKAVQEMDVFWESEWAKLRKNGGDRVPEDAIKAETKRLMAKYDLIEDGKSHDAANAEEAFEKTGMKNFLGENEKYFKGPSYNLTDGEGDKLYFYSDAGTVGFVGGDDKIEYEVHSDPDNIFSPYSRWNDPQDNQVQILKEWDIVDNNGIVGKCNVERFMYPSKPKDPNGEMDEELLTYKYITFVKGHKITIYAFCEFKDDPYDQSKEKFTDFINNFEFDKI